MIIPIGDTPNPRFTPWVNYALIAANVVVFLLFLPDMAARADLSDPVLKAYIDTIVRERGGLLANLSDIAAHVSAYDLVVFQHGYRPTSPSLIDALTSMFLHGGWAHLAGNMLFLWIYGDNVEHRMGRWQYAVFYIGVGIAGALGDGLLRSQSGIPTVGASGAISGVLGAYFLWFPANRVRLFVFLFPFLMRTFEVPARWVLGAYIVLNNLVPVLFAGSTGSVSYGAHLGGFGAGLFVAFIWARLFELPEADVLGYRDFEVRSADPVAGFRSALASGAFEHAAGLLMRMPGHMTRERVAIADKLDLAAALEDRGLERAALAVLERALKEHEHGCEVGEAKTSAARLTLHFGQPVQAWQLLQQARAMRLEPDVAREADELEHALRQRLRVVPTDGWW